MTMHTRRVNNNHWGLVKNANKYYRKNMEIVCASSMFFNSNKGT
jgi:hypothetical protein